MSSTLSLHDALPIDPATNAEFPDTGAVYWSSQITMPAGSSIVFNGQFANALYQSFTTYAAATRDPIDSLNDVGTQPDPGSTDPFAPGADPVIILARGPPGWRHGSCPGPMTMRTPRLILLALAAGLAAARSRRDRKSTRLNSSHELKSRMPSSA